MEAAHLPWRPIGELFVEKGLISADDLEQALAEQAATGLRLGEILVNRKLISSPDLTQALMEQLGREVAKEEGFGSGLWSEILRRTARTDSLDPMQSETDPTPFGGGLTRRLEVVSDLDDPSIPSLEESAAHDRAANELQVAPVEIEAPGEAITQRDPSLAESQVEVDLITAAALEHEREGTDAQQVVNEFEALRGDYQTEADRRQAFEAAAADRQHYFPELEASLEDSERGDGLERSPDDGAAADRQALERELGVAREHVTQQEVALADLFQRMAELESTLSTEREVRAEARRYLENAAGQAEQTRLALEEIDRGFEAAMAERDKARAELVGAHQNPSDQEQQLVDLHAELTTVTKTLDEERRAHEQTQEQVQQLTASWECASAEQERLETELAATAATAEQLQQENAELTDHAADLSRQVDAATAALADDRSAGDVDAKLSDAEARLGELAATIEQLEQESEERARVFEQRRTAIESQLNDATARHADEAASHSETRRVLAQALEELAGRQPEALAARSGGPDNYLCFIAANEGYRLLDRTGPLPTLGDEFTVDEGTYVVTRVGRSPLPFDARRCVYLLAVG
jgi:chromosome segregation ATPase